MIPRIDVRLNRARGEYAGELAFEFEGDNSLIDLPDTRFASCVKAALRYEILEDDTVEITGTLTFMLDGPCSRCLTPVQQEVTAKIEAEFVPGEGDGDSYGYSGGFVDLRELMRDTVLVALPSTLECDTPCELPKWIT